MMGQNTQIEASVRWRGKERLAAQGTVSVLAPTVFAAPVPCTVQRLDGDDVVLSIGPALASIGSNDRIEVAVDRAVVCTGTVK